MDVEQQEIAPITVTVMVNSSSTAKNIHIQIDLDHKHKGEQPHKHVGYNHTGDGKMHHADRQLIKRIEKIWKEYQENEIT